MPKPRDTLGAPVSFGVKLSSGASGVTVRIVAWDRAPVSWLERVLLLLGILFERCDPVSPAALCDHSDAVLLRLPRIEFSISGGRRPLNPRFGGMYTGTDGHLGTGRLPAGFKSAWYAVRRGRAVCADTVVLHLVVQPQSAI